MAGVPGQRSRSGRPAGQATRARPRPPRSPPPPAATPRGARRCARRHPAQTCYASARMVARLPSRPSEFRTGPAAVDTGLSQAGQGQGHGIELQGKLETRAVDGTEP